MIKKLLLLIPLVLFCASLCQGQISWPRGSMTAPSTVALLPLIGNSNLLYDVRDGNPNCSTGGGSTRVICHWNGATYDTVSTGSGISGLTTNTLPKAVSATALGDSRITDDGNEIEANSGTLGSFYAGDVDFAGTGLQLYIADSENYITLGAGKADTTSNGLQISTGLIKAGDFNSITTATKLNLDVAGKTIGLDAGGSEFINIDGNLHIVTATAATESLTLDGTLHTVATVAGNTATITAGNSSLTLDRLTDTASLTAPVAITNQTPLWKAGATGAEFILNGSGFITQYGGAGAVDGVLLIGNSGAGRYDNATLTAQTGIAITNSPGQIGIALDGTTPKKNSIQITAQSASIGATNIQVDGAVAPAGLYRLSYYLVTTTAGTSGTVSATFGWSDPAAARTSGTGNITFGTLATPATGTVVIRANGVANITYLTTVTAAVGSPVYALYITLERLQ